MTSLLPVLNITGEMAKLLIDGSEYEKLLDADLKTFTNDLKNLSLECLPKVSKTRCKHHNLVKGEGLSRRGVKIEIAALKEDIQNIKDLKAQYPKLLEKGLTKFFIPCDSLVGKAIKEFYDAFINCHDTAALPPEGTLQPIVDSHLTLKEAGNKLMMEYTRVLLK